MVKISVIVPVYNTEKYLRECLDSVVNQTFKDIEIICINDGSTDNSLDILKEYEKLDGRVTVFSQENSGQSVARNKGIGLANGEYIYFMDSDDYLELNAFEEIYNKCYENDLDLIVFKLINFDDGSSEKYTSEYYEMEPLTYLDGKVFNLNDIGENALNFAVSPPGKLFKRELIENIEFPQNFIFEDNLFFAEALLNAKRVSFYNKHLYNRRMRVDSTTTTKDIRFADSIIIINKIIDLSKKHDVYEEFKYGLARKKIDFALIRYLEVDLEFREEFFKKVHQDFKNFEEDYEKNILDKLESRYLYIFRCFISSSNHKEFDLKRDIFNLKMKNKIIKNDNKKLKINIKELNKQINQILSSTSWKITKPLRLIANLFK